MSNLFEKASLVMIPSGYKAGKLYSVKPTDGTGDFTHARTTVANRVNAANQLEEMGVDVPRVQFPTCPSVLLEPSRTNYLAYSQDFSQWLTSGGGSVDDPAYAMGQDGTMTAAKLTGISTSDIIYRTVSGLTDGSTYNGSIYIKNIDSTLTRFRTSTNTIFLIDITWTGAEITGITGGTYETLSDGWYRVTGFGTLTGNTNAIVRIYPSYTAATGSIIVWGVQLEEEETESSYIKTEATTVTRAVDSCTLTDLIVNGILASDQGTIADKRDGVSYVSRYTTDGNVELFVDGVSQGAPSVGAVPTTFNLTVPSLTEQVTMYPAPLTNSEIIELN